MDVRIINRYNSQLCSHADDLFLAFETAGKAEVKMHFAIHVKAWRAWRYYSSTEYFYYVQCLIEVSGESDTPTALTHGVRAAFAVG
jgi:hypothetical protein